MSAEAVLDEQTIAEVESLPQLSVDEMKLRAYAYELGSLILEREYGIEENN